MKKVLTAAIASLALFAFGPIEAEAGGKKKNKGAKVHKHHNHGFQNKAHRNYNRSGNTPRFTYGKPAYRSYYRSTPKSFRPIPRMNTNDRSYLSHPAYSFSGLSPYFGNRGHYCR